MASRIPIFILAGSDSAPGPVPAGLEPSRILRGFKGALELSVGHCLVQELVNRIRKTELFGDPILFGPRRIYRDAVDCTIIDVEGNLTATLSAVRSELLRQRDYNQPVAFVTCDVLPTAEEIRNLLEGCYFPFQSSCLWGQFVMAKPSAMGASAWKPSYRLRPNARSEACTMYPGHLLIARPAGIRIRLMNHLLQLAYQHRNLRLLNRPLPIFLRGIGQLVAQDVRNLLRGQVPVLAFSIPWHALAGFIQYQRGALSVEDFSRHAMKVLVHRDFQIHGGSSSAVVFSTTAIKSFAKDSDTQDELLELTTSTA